MMPKYAPRKILIFALLSAAMAITSCGADNSMALTTPTATVTLTIIPSLTPTHRPSPSITPSSTISPQQKDMLSYFPLTVGDQRVYEASITYATGLNEKNKFNYQEWHGFVHQNVVKQYATKTGIAFDLYYPDYPSINTDNVSTGELTTSLEFRDDGVYESDDLKFLFPLSVGQEWLAFGPDFPEYKWGVEAKDKITTPVGQFDECYSLSLMTRPDTTNIWFCKGIGVVEESAFHHPPEWMYKWQLYSFTKGLK